jgi:hypothetical protein
MGSMFAGNWIKGEIGLSSAEAVIGVMLTTILANLVLFLFGGKRRKDSIALYSSLFFVGSGQFYRRKWMRGLLMTGLFVGCAFYKLNAGESLADTIIVVMTLVSPIEAFITHNSSSSGYAGSGSSGYSSSYSDESSYSLADQMEDEHSARFQEDLHSMSDDFNHHY